jgi:hypothetical protein
VSINSQVYLNYNKLKECLFEKKQKKKSKKWETLITLLLSKYLVECWRTNLYSSLGASL